MIVKHNNITNNDTNIHKKTQIKTITHIKTPMVNVFEVVGNDYKPSVLDKYFFEKNKKTNFCYHCICGYGKPLRNWSDEKTHKLTEQHKKCLLKQKRLCRQKYELHETNKKRMKEIEESIAHDNKKIQKLNAKILDKQIEYERLEMEIKRIGV